MIMLVSTKWLLLSAFMAMMMAAICEGQQSNGNTNGGGDDSSNSGGQSDTDDGVDGTGGARIALRNGVTGIRTVVPIRGRTNFFQCPMSDGQFPYPGNCSQYYQCDHGVPTVMDCQEGLVFNPQRAYCDWPQSVSNCGGGTGHGYRGSGGSYGGSGGSYGGSGGSYGGSGGSYGGSGGSYGGSGGSYGGSGGSYGGSSGGYGGSSGGYGGSSGSYGGNTGSYGGNTGGQWRTSGGTGYGASSSDICSRLPYGGDPVNGFHVAHPNFCNAFYTCNNNYLTAPCIFCPESMYFSETDRTCHRTSRSDQVSNCQGKTMVPHAEKVNRQLDGSCWPHNDRPNPYANRNTHSNNNQPSGGWNSGNSGQGCPPGQRLTCA